MENFSYLPFHLFRRLITGYKYWIAEKSVPQCTNRCCVMTKKYQILVESCSFKRMIICEKVISEPPVATTEPLIITTEPPIVTTETLITTTEPLITTTEPLIATTEPPITTTEPPTASTSTQRDDSTTYGKDFVYCLDAADLKLSLYDQLPKADGMMT